MAFDPERDRAAARDRREPPVRVQHDAHRDQAQRLSAPLRLRLHRAVRARTSRATSSRRRSPGPQARRTSFDFSRYSVPVKWIFRLAAAVLALALLCVGAAYGYLRLSLPKVAGEIRLAGLGAPVEVLRDRYGIPHISAQTLEDASLRAGLRARAGPALADGDEPAHRRRAPGGDPRPGRRWKPTASCARSACAARPRPTCAQLDAETRRLLEPSRRRQRVPRRPARCCRPNSGSPALAPEPWSRLDSVAWIEDDGLGPRRQLAQRAAAHAALARRCRSRASTSSCRPIRAKRRRRSPT